MNSSTFSALNFTTLNWESSNETVFCGSVIRRKWNKNNMFMWLASRLCVEGKVHVGKLDASFIGINKQACMRTLEKRNVTLNAVNITRDILDLAY